MTRILGVLAMVGTVSCSSCGSHPPPPAAPDAAPIASGSASATAAAVEPPGTPKAPVNPGNPSKPGKYDVTQPSSAAEVAEYLKGHIPTGGAVEASDPPKVTHTVAQGDTIASIAKSYLPLSDLYYVNELVNSITQKNPGGAIVGKPLVIPHMTTRVIHDNPQDERLGWPEDKALRGIFITGPYAGIKWVESLDKLQERGLNAVVLDGKDYEGYLNYPSKAKIAVETEAMRTAFIPDLARAIRFAHWRGVRIILRIPCFHDPWADKHAKDARLSIRYTPTGKPIHVDWIDPTNTEAQDYAIELAKEGVEAGADEIQLDYVRFPVHLSDKVAVLPKKEDRKDVIRDFVKRVHAVTSGAGAALSLDFFGVAATGTMDDILYLGQHIPTVAPEADAISLMSYPSHYSKGWMGFAEPGEHPEVVGIGNKEALKQIKPTGAATIFRTWLQAFPQRSPNYGPQYVATEAKVAEATGGIGWLMWSAACEYSAVWAAFPPLKKK